MFDRKQKLLRLAADLVGEHQLAAALDVPHSTLETWMDGRATMPTGKLFALVDLLDRIANGAKQTVRPPRGI